MGLIEDYRNIFHYKKIEEYVKKNRKDDIQIGTLYIVAAVFISILSMLAIVTVNEYVSDMIYGIVPEEASAVQQYPDFFSYVGLEGLNLIFYAIASAIVGFFSTWGGLAATHYVAKALGGKGKLGEYIYVGGQFVLGIAIINFFIGVFNFVPCISCIAGIFAIAFVIYALWLFILMVSSLYSVDKAKAFIGLAGGYIATIVIWFVIGSIIGVITGLPVGIELINKTLEYMEAMSAMGYGSYSG